MQVILSDRYELARASTAYSYLPDRTLEQIISEGVFEQGLYAEVHGTEKT